MQTSAVTCRGAYMKKGHLLRKKCGQIKLQQLHPQDDLFVSGRNLVTLSGLPVFIPTRESIEFFHELLFAQNTTGTVVVLLSTLRCVKASLRRNLETHLFTLQTSQRIVFLDEFCPSLQLSQRVQEHETVNAYQCRLLHAAGEHLSSVYGVSVAVITSDLADSSATTLSGTSIASITVAEYLRRCNLYDNNCDLYKSLIECLLQSRHRDSSDSVKEQIYAPHMPPHEALAAVRCHRAFRGTLRTSHFSYREGVVQLDHDIYGEILVAGWECINRAMNGDDVVVELLPEEEWTSVASELRLVQQYALDDQAIVTDDDVTNADDVDNKLDVKVAAVSDKRTPCGRIVSIVRRKFHEIVVTVPRTAEEPKHKNVSQDVHILTIPVDRSYPLIRIRTKQWNILQGQRIVVAVSDWSIDSMYPNGYLVRTLGDANSWESELNAILWKNNIFLRPFSLAALACLPEVPVPPPVLLPGQVPKQWVDSQWRIEEPIRDRRDIRRCRDVFSVDPPGCQDIDDAMSVYWIEDGILEIGIHIADVCAFVQQDSALDAEAQERGTTVYLPHTRVDMLPALIASDIASLHANRDRYSVSVFFHMKIRHHNGLPVKESEVIDLSSLSDAHVDLCMTPVWSGRCVIHSIAAMTYSQAHNILHYIDPDAENDRIVPDGQAGQPIPKPLHHRLRKHLSILTLVSRTLAKYRIDQGALNLSQSSGTQLKFEMTDGSDPYAVHGHEKLEINSTIEELMILANSAVATTIYDAFPHSALLRTHSPASLHKLQQVADIFQTLGIAIFRTTDDKNKLFSALRDYKSLLEKNGNVSEETLNYVTSVIIRAMEEAQYICTSGQVASSSTDVFVAELGHFGLGLQFYTHFTSPIRRYADIIVHRQLLQALEFKKQKPVVKVIDDGSVEAPVSLPESLTMELLQDENEGFKTHQTLGISRAPDGRRKYDKVSVIPATEPAGTLSTMRRDLADKQQNVHDDSSQDEQLKRDSCTPSSALDNLLVDVGLDFTGSKSQSSHDDVFMINNNALDSLLGDIGLEFSATTQLCDVGAPLSSSNTVDELLGLSHDNSNDVMSKLLYGVPDEYQPIPHMTNINLNPKKSSCQSSGYDTSQIMGISSHLNAKNRNAKRAQQECQFMFLCKYFEHRSEDHIGVVYSLKENGFLVYVPAYDYKGSVYLTNTDGALTVSSSLVKLPRSTDMESYRLVLVKSTEGRPMELVCCPKNESPETVSGPHVFKLIPMQRVRVRLTAVKRTSISMPDLSIELLDACVNESYDMCTPTEYKTILKTGPMLDGKAKRKNDVEKENSLYNCVQRLSSDVIDVTVTAKVQRKLAAEAKRLNIKRYDLPTSGKVLFATPTEARNFFVSCDVNSSVSKSDALVQLAVESSKGGKEAAMIKMQQWGEEWADEEDLPNGVAADYEVDIPDSALVGRYRKDIAIATQRQQKLKIAKKSSKY